jgi:hypothetical protein
MTERDRLLIEQMKSEQNLDTLQAMILLVLADEPEAQPGGSGVVEQEIIFLLESRFSAEDLREAEEEYEGSL